MTTFYHYQEDGKLASVLEPLRTPDTHHHSRVHAPKSSSSSTCNTTLWSSELHKHGRTNRITSSFGDTDEGIINILGELPGQSEVARRHSTSYYAECSHLSVAGRVHDIQATSLTFFPDPETIRAYHDLYTLLGHVDPARLRSARDGPTLSIVENETEHVFAYEVPKKMLVLFCGRHIVSKYLRTLQREDDEHWTGPPMKQELRLPVNVANQVGVKTLVSWMMRACQLGSTQGLKPIRVPDNHFAAISLARTLNILGLRRDASHVDRVMLNRHAKRPLYLDEIRSIWFCLPSDSKYVYRMVRDLQERLAHHEAGNKARLKEPGRILAFLNSEPGLMARVHDSVENEKYRPIFETEWCRKLAPSPG